jgi:chaperonin GroES
MKLKPLHDWTLVRPSRPIEKTAGGIFIPEAAKEEPQEGEVLDIGKGCFKEKKDKKGKVIEKTFVKTTVRPGDRVLYEKYSAVRIPMGSEELVMVREENVLGWLNESNRSE